MVTMMTILPGETAEATAEQISRKVTRRIDPATGRALVILSHAIEYLADEFAHEGGSNRGQADAIQLLMALDRQIYLACPEVPTFRQRLVSLLYRKLKPTKGEGELASGLGRSQVQAEL